MREFVIGKNDAGQRLDRFVAKNLPLLPLFSSLRNGNSIGISPCSDRMKPHSSSIGSFAMLFRLLTLL